MKEQRFEKVVKYDEICMSKLSCYLVPALFAYILGVFIGGADYGLESIIFFIFSIIALFLLDSIKARKVYWRKI